MWTMAYVVSGTLMVVPSFGRMSAEQIHDLSRLYPYHAARKSARPVDAFTAEYPRVYDYAVTPAWHQVTLHNTDTGAPADIAVDLAGDTAFGALGLDPGRRYYAYDFWNDRLAGVLAGNARLSQTLRPGEARMLSVRAAEDYPQPLSTNRHLMQGMVDLLDCRWDASRRVLRGISAVAGGEPYKIVIAANGYIARAAGVDDSIARSIERSTVGSVKRPASASIRALPGEPALLELTIERGDTGQVAWTVTFEGAR
jgi:hypothetical protein